MTLAMSGGKSNASVWCLLSVCPIFFPTIIGRDSRNTANVYFLPSIRMDILVLIVKQAITANFVDNANDYGTEMKTGNQNQIH